MNDQDIVELIRVGKNSKALNKLYLNFPVIRKMVLANGGTGNDAEDVFQEALIILIRKIRHTDFKLTSRLNTYLFSVCRFVWGDELKKRNRPIPDEFIVAQSSFEQQEFADAIATEHKAKLAERVLDELKDRCRELLILFYHQKMKLQDIAIKMGYNSENSAKNQKYKCLEAAKSKLSELQKNSLTF